MVVCPNPNCRKEIKEPILLTIRSVTPYKEYEACPFCFTDLQEKLDEKNETQESESEKEKIEPEKEAPVEIPANPVLEKEKVSGPQFLKRFKSLIPSNGDPKKRKRRKLKKKLKSKKKVTFQVARNLLDT